MRHAIVIPSFNFLEFLQKNPFWSSYFLLESTFRKGELTFFIFRPKFKYINLFEYDKEVVEMEKRILALVANFMAIKN